MLYYVFDDEETAIRAENYICQIGQVPITGINAQTGKIFLSAKTLRWATPQKRLDGKWCFPYVGDERVNQYPPTVASYFEDEFSNTKEEYQEDWFSNPDEE